MKTKAIIIALIILLGVFIVFSVVSMIVIHLNFKSMFGRSAVRPSVYLRYEDIEEGYPRELLSFKSGNNTLQGYLYGENNQKGLVVISHGIGGGAVSYLAETLYFVDHGYSVFGFDNTGCHQSEGDGCNGMSQSLIDLDAALDFIESQERFAGLPVYLYGHSWGGYAVATVLGEGHNITAAASVSGYNSPDRIVFEWVRDNMGLGALAYLEAPYISLYHRIVFGRYADKHAVDAINSCTTPILVIHGVNDDTVSYKTASIICQKNKIKNPNVMYMICAKKDHDDHNRLYMSDTAVTYTSKLSSEMDELKSQYKNGLPDEVLEDFCSKADKRLASGLDSEFMQNIIAFYESAPLKE